MTPTLIFIKHTEIGGRAYHHGSELPPGASQVIINQLIDSGAIIECPERRSLFRLFAPFSGCTETEFTKEEIDALS